MPKPSVRPRRSTLSSGLLTALSLAVVTGLSAAVGVVIAREFGRGADTDGFFAAYGVFLVVVLAAGAVRVAVLPALARARDESRFGAVLASYALAVSTVAVPALALGVLANDWTAGQLTGGLPPSASQTAADALVFLVPAAVAHLFAALAASALAAHDSYGTAAAGYALGSALGLSLILWRVGEDGIVACAWGTLLNAAVALAVPLAALVLAGSLGRFRAARRPRTARRARAGSGAADGAAGVLRRLSALRERSRHGRGHELHVRVPRRGGSRRRDGVVARDGLERSALASLALGGARDPTRRQHVARLLRGASPPRPACSRSSATGSSMPLSARPTRVTAGNEIGGLIVLLGPWMAASIGVTITFPMLFVAGRDRRLPLLAVAALVLHVVATWIAVSLFELDGAAVALTVSTLVVLVALLLLLSPQVLSEGARGLLLGAAVTGGLALAAFGAASALLPEEPAAAVGAVVFAGLLLAARGSRAAAGLGLPAHA